MASSWTDLLISYLKTGEIKKCPVCSGNSVVVKHILNSITFECLTCGKFRHFDSVSSKSE